jgi:predicted ribosomally synthesized peptide with SipW-like signal peptide
MLIGTTFAWFTDTVSSGRNTIRAGNLDVGLQYAELDTDGTIKKNTDDSISWKDVGENTELFKDTALWEPGYTQVVYLKVSNLGTLALDYKFMVKIIEEQNGSTHGVPKRNDTISYKLSDYIYYAVDTSWNGTTPYSRSEAQLKVNQADSNKLNVASTNQGSLQGNDNTNYVALLVYMPYWVGNEANYATGGNIPKITLGIELNATQSVYESDSFGNDYDKDAKLDSDTGDATGWYTENVNSDTYTISTANELASLAALVNEGTADFSGKTITLQNDITLGDVWTPIGTEDHPFKGKFDGNGHTISGVSIKSLTEGIAGFFGVIDGAEITGLTLQGTINVTAVEDTKIGGFCAVAENTSSITKCTNEMNIQVTAIESDGLQIGGILSCAGSNYTTNVTIEDCLNIGNIGVEGNPIMSLVGGITAIIGAEQPNVDKVVNVGNLSSGGTSCAVGGITGNFYNTNITNKNWYSLNVPTYGTDDDEEAGTEKMESMTSQGSFTGLDFENTWELTNGQYPTLKKS